mmetsp:Transcript_35518/g.65233  ORF Transcript_35518/g.65233 Transcript_35518/m.65233 type:complete len:255 (-) Transcript_35518:499-1263(-)
MTSCFQGAAGEVAGGRRRWMSVTFCPNYLATLKWSTYWTHMKLLTKCSSCWSTVRAGNSLMPSTKSSGPLSAAAAATPKPSLLTSPSSSFWHSRTCMRAVLSTATSSPRTSCCCPAKKTTHVSSFLILDWRESSRHPLLPRSDGLRPPFLSRRTAQAAKSLAGRAPWTPSAGPAHTAVLVPTTTQPPRSCLARAMILPWTSTPLAPHSMFSFVAIIPTNSLMMWVSPQKTTTRITTTIFLVATGRPYPMTPRTL